MAQIFDGDRILQNEEVIVKNLLIKDKGCNNIVCFDDFSSFDGGNDRIHITFSGSNNRVWFGKNVGIHRGLKIFIYPGGGGFHGDNCEIIIGDNTYVNGENVSLECGEENTKIVIGKDCLLAHDIKLTTTDNHIIYSLDSKERVNPPGDIIIGNHVWICGEVRILNHSIISDDSVVALRAVVCKEFNESNVVIGGVPAKIIRRNCNWER